VNGIKLDLTNNYTLHASGNTLTGLDITMGNGGSGISTGVSIGGASDYGITLSGYTSSALRFDTGATTFSSDLNYNISADPGGSGDFVLYSLGGSKFAIDTSGTSSPETGYFSLSASTSSTIGTNLDAGIYLDFQTNTSSSNTDFFPIMIQTKSGTGGGIYLDGCNGAGPGAEACDDGADWTQDGIVFRDFRYDITTATDSLGEGDFWLDMVPKGDGGVRVTLDVTDGIQGGDDADNKKFHVTSSIFEGDATQELFEVERSDGGVNFTGVLARFTNLESSSGSHGDAVIIENDAGGDSIGLTITQRQVGIVDAGGCQGRLTSQDTPHTCCSCQCGLNKVRAKGGCCGCWSSN
jgi:hypothetical protein